MIEDIDKVDSSVIMDEVRLILAEKKHSLINDANRNRHSGPTFIEFLILIT